MLSVNVLVEEAKSSVSVAINNANSGYHGIDQRAQSGTFKNQKKFWLEPGDLNNIYENKSTVFDRMERSRPPP